jgi:hypothetical protein
MPRGQQLITLGTPDAHLLGEIELVGSLRHVGRLVDAVWPSLRVCPSHSSHRSRFAGSSSIFIRR